jgi:hypothetical protein
MNVERTEGGIVAANIVDWIDQPIAVEFVTREEDSEPQQTRYTLEGADESEPLAASLSLL